MITADALIQCQYAKQFSGYFLMTKLSLKKTTIAPRHQHQLIIAWKTDQMALSLPADNEICNCNIIIKSLSED